MVIQKFRGHVNGVKVQVVDTTGAGDAFCAGLLSQLAVVPSIIDVRKTFSTCELVSSVFFSSLYSYFVTVVNSSWFFVFQSGPPCAHSNLIRLCFWLMALAGQWVLNWLYCCAFYTCLVISGR